MFIYIIILLDKSLCYFCNILSSSTRLGKKINETKLVLINCMVRIATYPIVKMRTNGTVSLQSHPGISESYYNI